jgi:hypothetical protein
MASAIDITKPVYGNPTTQSVRDNFEHAYDEITTLQSDVANRVHKDGDTMTGFLSLFADPTLAMHAANRSWVINQIKSTANAMIYVGDYDAQADQVLTSGQATIPIGSSLPAPAPSNTQMYFTVKVGSATSIGHQPPGGVPVGSWLISNGVIWNVYQPSSAGVTAQSVPVNPEIVGLPGTDVYTALSSVPTLYLPLVGGQISGDITLGKAPTLGGHLTNKTYVDGKTFVIPPDPIVHSLTLNTINQTTKTLYGTENGFKHWSVALGGGGANDDFAIGRYDNSGVAIDGCLSIERSNGNVTFNHSVFLAPAVADPAIIYGRNNNPTNAAYDCLWLQGRNIQSATLKLFGPTSANPNAAQFIAFSADSSTYSAYTFANTVASFPSYIYFDNTAGVNYNGLRWSYGGNLSQTSDGGFTIERSYGNRILLSNDGSIHFQGGNNYTSNAYVSDTTFWVAKDVSAVGDVYSRRWVCQNYASFTLDGNSIECHINHFPGVYSYASTSTYNVGLYIADIGGWYYRRSDVSICNDIGAMFALAFNLISDENLKMNIATSDIGLKEILGINPITYYRDKTKKASVKPFIEYKPEQSPEEALETERIKNDMKSKEWKAELEFGFSAQQVQTSFPQAVLKYEQDEPDSTLGISLVAIVAGLVNAVKELNTEVQTMKRRGKL